MPLDRKPLYDLKADQIDQSLPARLRQELKEDARIAEVALVFGVAIWTCNLSDYAKVPGLTLFDASSGMKVS